MLKADPDQIADDVAAVESFLKEEPEKRLAFLLADRLQARQSRLCPEGAADREAVVAGSEHGVAVASDRPVDATARRNTTRPFCDALDEEGTKGKEDTLSIAARRPTPQWDNLLATYRRAIQFFEIADKLNAQVHKLKVLKPGPASVRAVPSALERRAG